MALRRTQITPETNSFIQSWSGFPETEKALWKVFDGVAAPEAFSLVLKPFDGVAASHVIKNVRSYLFDARAEAGLDKESLFRVIETGGLPFVEAEESGADVLFVEHREHAFAVPMKSDVCVSLNGVEQELSQSLMINSTYDAARLKERSFDELSSWLGDSPSPQTGVVYKRNSTHTVVKASPDDLESSTPIFVVKSGLTLPFRGKSAKSIVPIERFVGHVQSILEQSGNETEFDPSDLESQLASDVMLPDDVLRPEVRELLTGYGIDTLKNGPEMILLGDPGEQLKEVTNLKSILSAERGRELTVSLAGSDSSRQAGFLEQSLESRLNAIQSIVENRYSVDGDLQKLPLTLLVESLTADIQSGSTQIGRSQLEAIVSNVGSYISLSREAGVPFDDALSRQLTQSADNLQESFERSLPKPEKVERTDDTIAFQVGDTKCVIPVREIPAEEHDSKLFVAGAVTATDLPHPPEFDLVDLHQKASKELGSALVPESSDASACKPIIAGLKKDGFWVGIYDYLPILGQQFSDGVNRGVFSAIDLSSSNPRALLNTGGTFPSTVTESQLLLFGLKPFDPQSDDNVGWNPSHALPASQREKNRQTFQSNTIPELQGKIAYSGTGSALVRSDGTVGFDRRYSAAGVSQEGYGTYFAVGGQAPHISSSYAYATKEDANKLGGFDQPNVTMSYLRVENPIFDNDERTLTREQMLELIENSPDKDEQLMNFGEIDFEGEGVVVQRAINTYIDLPLKDAYIQMANDFYNGSTEYSRIFKKITGYDGVVIKSTTNPDDDTLIVNVFDAESDVKSAFSSLYSPDVSDIRFSLTHQSFHGIDESLLDGLSDYDFDDIPRGRPRKYFREDVSDLDRLLRKRVEKSIGETRYVRKRAPVYPKVTSSLDFRMWHRNSQATSQDGSPIVFYRGTLSDDTVLDGPVKLVTSPVEASMDAKAEELMQVERLRDSLIPSLAEPVEMTGMEIPFVGALSEVPADLYGQVVGTDEGIVRVHSDGTWEIFDNYVVDSEQYPENEAMVFVKEGDNSRLLEEKKSEFEELASYFGKVQQGRVQPLFVRTLNPKEIDEYLWTKMEAEPEAKDILVKNAEAEGYDSIVVKKDGEITKCLALNGSNIKLAVGNYGTFSHRNPDIRFSLAHSLDNEAHSLDTQGAVDYSLLEIDPNPTGQAILEDDDLYGLTRFRVNYHTDENNDDELFWFENHDEFFRYVDNLVGRANSDPDFKGLMLPNDNGFITVTPSAKSPGFWQKTCFDKTMLPLYDDGAQDKEDALRGFFEDCRPDLVLSKEERQQIWNKEFERWSRNTVVRDKDGAPCVAYHGTNSDFSEFREGLGYFTTRTDYGYIQKSNYVLPVYLNITNPYWPEHQSEVEMLRNNTERVEELKSQGYDGVIWAKKGDLMRGPSGWGNDYPQVVTFYPNQVKSAISNKGAFSDLSNDIRFKINMSVQDREPSEADLLAQGIKCAFVPADTLKQAVPGSPITVQSQEKAASASKDVFLVRVDSPRYLTDIQARSIAASKELASDPGSPEWYNELSPHVRELGYGAVITDSGSIHVFDSSFLVCGLTGRPVTEAEPLLRCTPNDAGFKVKVMDSKRWSEDADQQAIQSIKDFAGDTQIVGDDGFPELLFIDNSAPDTHGSGVYLTRTPSGQDAGAPCVVRSSNLLDMRLLKPLDVPYYLGVNYDIFKDHSSPDYAEMIRDRAVELGYDALVFQENGQDVFVAFDRSSVVSLAAFKEGPEAVARMMDEVTSDPSPVEQVPLFSEDVHVDSRRHKGRFSLSTKPIEGVEEIGYVPAAKLKPSASFTNDDAPHRLGFPIYSSKEAAFKDGVHSVAEVRFSTENPRNISMQYELKDQSRDALLEDGFDSIAISQESSGEKPLRYVLNAEDIQVTAWHSDPKWAKKSIFKEDCYVSETLARDIDASSLSVTDVLVSPDPDSFNRTPAAPLPLPARPESLVFGTNVSPEALRFSNSFMRDSLVAPSFFISNISEPLENFGGISLIADPSLLSDRKIKTYASDAYSSRFPSHEFEIDRRVVTESLKPLRDAGIPIAAIRRGASTIEDLEKYGPKGVLDSPAFQLAYLLKKGIVRSDQIPRIKLVGDKAWLRKAFKEGLESLSRSELKDSSSFKKMVLKDVVRKNQLSIKLNAERPSPKFADRIDREIKEAFLFSHKASGKLPDGYEYQGQDTILHKESERSWHGSSREKALERLFESFDDESAEVLKEEYFNFKEPADATLDRYIKVLQDINATAMVDYSKLSNLVIKKISSKKTAMDFESWAYGEANSATKKAKMFLGFNDSGNPRYRPLTVESALKSMTNKSNQEGFHYGAGSLRSAYTPTLSGMKNIKDRKGSLVSEHEMRVVAERLQEEHFELCEALSKNVREGYSIRSTDVSEILSEGWRSIREHFELTPELEARIRDHIQDLVDAPTHYLEAKANREVYLNEFKVAVVPNNTHPEVIDLLAKQGLEIKKYNPDRPAHRAEIIEKLDKLHLRATPVTEADRRVSVKIQNPLRIAGVDHNADVSLEDILDRLDRGAQKQARSGSDVRDAIYKFKQSLAREELETTGKASEIVAKIRKEVLSDAILRNSRFDGILYDGPNGQVASPLSFVKQVRGQAFNDIAQSQAPLPVDNIYASQSGSNDISLSDSKHYDMVKESFDQLLAKEAIGQKVTLVKSPEEFPENVLNHLKQIKVPAASVKGFTHNGEIFIAASSIRSSSHLLKVVSHEAVGHKGLQGFLGDRLNQVLEEVYHSVDRHPLMESIKQAYPFLSPHNQDDRLELAEEFVAHASEERIFADLVGATKHAVHSGLRDIDAETQWSIKDIDDLIRQAHTYIESLAIANNCEPLEIKSLPFDRVKHLTDSSGEPFVAVRNPTRYEAASLTGASEGMVLKDPSTGDTYFTTDTWVDPSEFATGLGIKEVDGLRVGRVSKETIFNIDSELFWGGLSESNNKPLVDLEGPGHDDLYFRCVLPDGSAGLTKKATSARCGFNENGDVVAQVLDLGDSEARVLQLPSGATWAAVKQRIGVDAFACVEAQTGPLPPSGTVDLDQEVAGVLSKLGYDVVSVGTEMRLINEDFPSQSHRDLPHDQIYSSSNTFKQSLTILSASAPETEKKIDQEAPPKRKQNMMMG